LGARRPGEPVFRWSFLADLPNSGNPTDRRINVRRVRIGQGEFSGQSESEKNAKEACKRDFADKGKDPRDGDGPMGVKPGSEARIGACLLIRQPLLSGTRTRSTSGTRPANLFRSCPAGLVFSILNQPTRLTSQRPETRNRRSVGSDGLRIGLDFVGVRGECARLSLLPRASPRLKFAKAESIGAKSDVASDTM